MTSRQDLNAVLGGFTDWHDGLFGGGGGPGNALHYQAVGGQGSGLVEATELDLTAEGYPEKCTKVLTKDTCIKVVKTSVFYSNFF